MSLKKYNGRKNDTWILGGIMPEDKYARVRVDSTTFVGHTIKLVEQLTSKVRLLRPKSKRNPSA
jgi:hypothetical protein